MWPGSLFRWPVPGALLERRDAVDGWPIHTSARSAGLPGGRLSRVSRSADVPLLARRWVLRPRAAGARRRRTVRLEGQCASSPDGPLREMPNMLGVPRCRVAVGDDRFVRRDTPVHVSRSTASRAGRHRGRKERYLAVRSGAVCMEGGIRRLRIEQSACATRRSSVAGSHGALRLAACTRVVPGEKHEDPKLAPRPAPICPRRARR